MTRHQCEIAGRKLFGPYWVNPLSRMLKIDQSTLRRWLSSGFIPEMASLAIKGAVLEAKQTGKKPPRLARPYGGRK